jgi:hypothetical protein
MITKEKIEHHIRALQEKHDELDKEIQLRYSMHENDFTIENLKKSKLHLKDQIEINRAKIYGLVR